MAKFCMNCGAPLDDAVKFCTGCGTQQVQPPPQAQTVLPVQAEQQTVPATQTATMGPKKKSKTPLIAIAMLCAVCILGVGGWLVWKNFFANKDPEQTNGNASAAQANSGNANSNSPRAGDGEVIMVPVGEGDRELVLEWLETFLEPDEYYEAVNGEYSLLPFGVTDDAPDRLEGYPVAGKQQDSGGQSDSGETAPGENQLSESEGWPADKLPSGVPQYPDGQCKAISVQDSIIITVSGTSAAGFKQYTDALKQAGWAIGMESAEMVYATKDGWAVVCNLTGADGVIISVATN